MASTQNTTGDVSQDHSTSTDAKRKVSILTDPPHIQGGGYDNPAFDGPRRKISQVCNILSCAYISKFPIQLN